MRKLKHFFSFNVCKFIFFKNHSFPFFFQTLNLVLCRGPFGSNYNFEVSWLRVSTSFAHLDLGSLSLEFYPKGSIFVLSNQRIFLLMLSKSFKRYLPNFEWAAICLQSCFCLASLPKKTWSIECCWDDCPSSRFSHPCRRHLKLC